MMCPVCLEVELGQVMLDLGLPAYRCGRCEGTWISSTEYWEWLEHHGETLPERAAGDILLAVHDSQRAKICPDCGHILGRYKVWPDIEFHLDRCAHCNGVWFDKNEWDVLVARNLHDKVNTFFTKPWQIKLREEESRKRWEQIYLERFGPEDYGRLKEMKQWLDDHPQRPALLAYLQADDPYRV
jgi:Zn-finger nucleic acid-binding protein